MVIPPARHEIPQANGRSEQDALDKKDSMSALGQLAAFDDAGLLSPLVESKPALPGSGAPNGSAMPSLAGMATAMVSATTMPGATHPVRPVHARGVSRSHTLPFANGAGPQFDQSAEVVVPPPRMTPSSSGGTESTVRPYASASAQPSPYDREPPAQRSAYDSRDRSPYGPSPARAPPGRNATYDSAMFDRKTSVPTRPPSRQASANYESAGPTAPVAAPRTSPNRYDGAGLERKANEAPIRPPSRSGYDLPASERAPASASRYDYDRKASVPARPPSRSGYDAPPESRALASTSRTSPSRPELSSYSSRHATGSASVSSTVPPTGYEASRYERGHSHSRSHSQRPSISASTMATASASASAPASAQRSPYDTTSPVSPTSPTYPSSYANGTSRYDSRTSANGPARYGTSSLDRSPVDSESKYSSRSSHERDRTAVPDIASTRTAYPPESRHRSTDSRPPVSSSAAYASRYDTQTSASKPVYTSRSSSSTRPAQTSSTSRYDSYEPKMSSTTPRSNATSPYYPSSRVSPSQPAAAVNNYSPSQQSARSRGSGSSHRTSSSGSYGNPLPAPPQPVSTSSARLASASASTMPPPATARRRKGFWNRRGDHLTADLQVVYAPDEYANPADLADYPSPVQGYLDHTGVFLKYDANRPELQDSLPRHGRPPKRPYPSVSFSSLHCTTHVTNLNMIVRPICLALTRSCITLSQTGLGLVLDPECLCFMLDDRSCLCTNFLIACFLAFCMYRPMWDTRDTMYPCYVLHDSLLLYLRFHTSRNSIDV
jgi:hypothetical protein